MEYTWVQEMVRLHRRIDVLEKENRMLQDMLLDAIGIADVALTGGSGQKMISEPDLRLFRPLKERGP